MTERTVSKWRRLPASVILAAAGLAAVVVCLLALLLPGQNIHGGKFTLFTFLFGLSVPPLCFALGFIIALRHRHQSGNLGVWLNSVGLGLYLLWVSGTAGNIWGNA